MRTTSSRFCVHLFILALGAAMPAASAAPTTAASALLFTPPACGAAPFSDVLAGDAYCPWIKQLTADGIAGTCATGRYCPNAPVTRGQAAMLIERAVRGTADWQPDGGLLRTVIVSPVLGDELASGQRLLDAIDGITDSSSSNLYLVWIEGGLYDLGSTQLAPPTGVYLTAPRLGETEIDTARNGTGFKMSGGTWTNLILKNNGPSVTTIGVDATNGRLEDVIAYANGGTATAILTGGGLARASGIASGSGTTVIGIDYSGNNGEIVDCQGFAAGGGAAYGLRVNAPNLRVTGGEFSARFGDFFDYAIFASGASGGFSPLQLRGVTATASGDISATPDVVGLKVADGDVIVENSHIEATNSDDPEYGLDCRGTADSRVEIHHSRLIGPSASVEADDADCVVRIGHSQLKGGAVIEGAGDVACVAAWNESYTSPGINTCF